MMKRSDFLKNIIPASWAAFLVGSDKADFLLDSEIEGEESFLSGKDYSFGNWVSVTTQFNLGDKLEVPAVDSVYINDCGIVFKCMQSHVYSSLDNDIVDNFNPLSAKQYVMSRWLCFGENGLDKCFQPI